MKTSSDRIKTSELQKEITKRRVWIIALTILMSLCYYVLGLILVLTQARQEYRWWYGENSDVSMKDYMCQSTSKMMGMASMTFLMTILVAIIMAYAAFSFLYKRQAVDFYFSAPLSRNRLFANIYLNGVAIYAGITLVFTILGLLIATCMNAVSSWVILYVTVNFLRCTLLYIAVYSITILAIIISKGRIVSYIAAFIFLAGEPLARVLLNIMKMSYYATSYELSYAIGVVPLKRPHILSPIYNHVTGIQIYEANCGDITQTGLTASQALKGIWKYDLATLILAVCVTAAVFMVFHYRKAEDIGTGYIKPYIKDTLKIFCAVSLALVGAAATDSVLETGYAGIRVMNIVFLVFVAGVSCVAAEMICAGSIKAGVKRLWHIIPASVCALIIFSIYKYDLTGYDSYIPDTDDIESCAMYKNYYGRDIFDEEGNYLNIEKYCIENMDLKDLDAVTKIVAAGMETQRRNMKAGSDRTGETDPENKYIYGNDAVVVYRLKNGRYEARRITIPGDIDESLMNRVIGTDEYRNCVFGLDMAREFTGRNIKELNTKYITVAGAREVTLPVSEFDRFTREYEKDLKKYDYTLAANKYPVGTVNCWNSAPDSKYVNYSYEVYDCFDNTMRFLEENGLYVEPMLDTDDIVKIEVSRYIYDEETDTSSESDVTFEDREDIEKLRGAIIQNMSSDWNIHEINSTVTMYVKDYSNAGKTGDYVVREMSELCIPDNLMPEEIDRVLREHETVEGE